MTRPLGVAFAGAGFISILHALALRACGRGRVVAVASQSRRAAEHRARLLGADAYRFAELRAMVERADVDVVFVLGPNALHREHALVAIEAGRHVVVEKPLATTIADARSIVEFAARRGVVVGYAENQVFSPVIVEARERVASGALGRVRRVVGFCGHAGPPAGSWFWDPRLAGGGAGFDMGSHTVETSLFLAGSPEVDAVLHAELEPHASGVDGRCVATLHTSRGIEIAVTSSFVEAQESIRYEVHGDEAVLHVTFAPAPFAQRLCIERTGREPEEIPLPYRDEMLRIDRYAGSSGYVGQLAHFFDCFATGATPSESAADGARVLAVLNAIYWAAGRKQPVSVADVPADRTPRELWTDALHEGSPR